MERAALNEIARRMAGAQRVAVLCHTHPDGDALGSAYALKGLLARMGKQACVLCADPVPARLSFLFHEDPSAQEAKEQPYDLIMTVDVASPEQLGALRAPFCDRVQIKLDHHLVSTDFGALGYVDPTAAAAGEIVYALAAELQPFAPQIQLLCPEIAGFLYCAISSDTGGFRYSNVTAHTLQIASALLAAGADGASISAGLFENMPRREAAALGYIYSHIQYFSGGRLAMVACTNETKAQIGFEDEDFGSASSLLRQIEGVDLAVSIRQSGVNAKIYKVSMRSGALVDSAALCARFGGGGHVRAAGCTVSADSVQEAQAQVLALCQEALHG